MEKMKAVEMVERLVASLAVSMATMTAEMKVGAWEYREVARRVERRVATTVEKKAV